MSRRWVAALILAAGCASAPIRPDDQRALDEADLLVRQGCYDCLLEARDTYAAHAVGRARPLVVERLFETDVLLALREKELALDPGEAIARARALAPELPSPIDGERILMLVEAVLPDDVGVPYARMQRLKHEQEERALDVDAEVAWLAASGLALPVRQYVSAALECSYELRPPLPGDTRARLRLKPDLPPDPVPLVEYRIAICFDIESEPLLRTLETVPRFVEASFSQARVELITADQNGGAAAREHLTAAYARFPDSPSVTFLFASFEQLIGDCRAALALYRETLAIVDAHEMAMLGRTACLSFLGEHDAAIASATEMVDRQTFNIAQAYYWRAWNHHVLEALETARADIELAKRADRSLEILTLAGIIEHDQDDLETAETDLTSARRTRGGDRSCTAAWYLGLVHLKQERFADSSAAFEDATRCYDLNVKEAEAGLASMRARTDIEPVFKARQIANFEQVILEDRNQYYASAFNTANQAAHAGDRERAVRFLAIAEDGTEPGLVKLVAQLRALLRAPS